MARLRWSLSQSVGPASGFGGPQLAQPISLAQATVQKSGLIEAFIKTCQRWRLNRQQQIVLLGYAGNDFLGAEFLAGRYVNAPQDVRDRASCLLGISIGLGAIFNEVA